MTATTAGDQLGVPSRPVRPIESATTAVEYSEAQLQGMSDRELNAVVAAAVFGEATDVGAASTTWSGFGSIVEHMVARGYTMLFAAFEASHLEWMNNLPDNMKRGDAYQPVEVSVVDICKRLAKLRGDVNWKVGAETLPRAAAIAAVLVCQMERVAGAPLDQLACRFADYAAKVAEVSRLRAQGQSDKKIADRYGVTVGAICQFRKRHGIQRNGTVAGGEGIAAADAALQ